MSTFNKFVFLSLFIILGCSEQTVRIPRNRTRSPAGIQGGTALVNATPGSYNFSNVMVGTTSTNTWILDNSGRVAATGIVFGNMTAPYARVPGGCSTTLPPGSSCSVTVSFSPLAAGAFPATLSWNLNNGVSMIPGSVTMTGTGSTPSVNFSSVSQSVSENVGSVTLTAVLGAPAGLNVTVPFSVSGSSSRPLDHDLIPGSLLFPPGSTTQSVTISVVDDTLYEGPETIVLTLGTPTNATLGSTSIHTINITDSDSPPVINFGPATTGTSESSGTLSIPVTLSNASTLPTSIDNLVTGSAINPSDHTLSNNTINIGPGNLSAIISIPLIDDTMDELDENIILTLSNPVNGSLGLNITHAITIIDNDPIPVVSFSKPSQNVPEDIGLVSIEVALSAATSLPVTVPFSVTGSSNYPSDHDLTPRSLTFSPGISSQTITLSVVDDSLAESTETIILSLGALSNAGLGAYVSHTVNIANNDFFPNIEASPPSILFLNVPVGGFKFQPVILSNSGSASATLLSIGTLPLPFNQTTNCGNEIVAGSSCLIIVSVAPATSGSQVTTLPYSFFDGLQTQSRSIPVSYSAVFPALVTISDSPTYTFPNTTIGQESKHTFNISNLGGSSAVFSSISVSSPFSISQNSCGTDLPAGNQCQIEVSFLPSVSGNVPSQLILNYSDGFASQLSTIGLIGRGETRGLLSFSPTELDFGVVATFSTNLGTVNLTNLGESQVQNISFSLSNVTDPSALVIKNHSCGSGLTHLSSCSVNIGFSPSRSGPVSGNLEIQYDDGVVAAQAIVLVSGQSENEANIQISNVNPFPDTILGEHSFQFVTLTNIGERPALNLQFSSEVPFSPPGTFFPSSTLQACANSLSPGEACSLQMSFSPNAPGTFQKNLVVSFERLDGTAHASLTPLVGVGIARANLGMMAPLDFGLVTTGAIAEGTVTILNSGSDIASNIAEASSPSSDFRYKGGTFPGVGGNCDDTLNPNEFCTLKIEFEPTDRGLRTGDFSLTYFNGSLLENFTVSVSGTGILFATLVFDMLSHDFGSVEVGDFSSISVTVKNTGETVATNLSTSVLDSDFSVLPSPVLSSGIGTSPSGPPDCVGSNLAPNEICKLNITFRPQTGGLHTTPLNLSYFDGAGTRGTAMALSGTGFFRGANLTISPATVDFGNVTVGHLVNLFLTVKNLGIDPAENVYIDPVPVSSPFSIQDLCPSTILPNASCTIRVGFLPSGIASFSDLITINYINFPDGQPKTVSSILSGSGITPAQLQFDLGTSINISTLVGSSNTFPVRIFNSGQTTANLLSIPVLAAPLGFTDGSYPGLNGTCVSSAILPGTGCTVEIVHTPTSSGNFVFDFLFIYDNGARTDVAVLTINANALNPAFLELSVVSPFDFGSTVVNSTKTQPITIKNTGQANATRISISTLPSSPFSILNSCQQNLGSGGECTVLIKFSPSSARNYTDNVTFSYESGLTKIFIPLTLTGTGSNGFVSVFLDGIDVTQSTSLTIDLGVERRYSNPGVGRTLEFVNHSSEALTPVLNSKFYLRFLDELPIPAGGRFRVQMFMPALTSGTTSENLTVQFTGSAGTLTFSYTLAGTVLASIVPLSLDPTIRAIQVASTSPSTRNIEIVSNQINPHYLGITELNHNALNPDFQVFNYGGTPLDISDIVSSNSLFTVNKTSFSIGTYQSATFKVTAHSKVVGTHTGTITIHSNDPDGPFIIPLKYTVLPQGPFVDIFTISDLGLIRQNPNKNFRLMNDLDLSQTIFTPISYFSGIFDGNGHTLLNFASKSSFFIDLAGTVRNLTFESFQSYIENGVTSRGALAQRAISGSLIENSHVTGIVQYPSSYGVSSGGLVGELFGTVHSSSAQMTFSSLGTNSGGFIVGMLVGLAKDGATIESCQTSGSINLSASVLGGMVGQTDRASILNSFSTVDIIGKSILGGFVGKDFSTTIVNSEFDGSIKDTHHNTSESGVCGGFIGEHVPFAPSTIKNSKARVNISCRGYSGGFVGESGPGGVSNGLDIENSEVLSGSVIEALSGFAGGFVGEGFNIKMKSLSADLTLRSNGHTGGIAGKLDLSTVDSAQVILRIEALPNCGSLCSYIYQGGLIGEFLNSTIKNSNATGAISGGDSQGGTVGYMLDSNIMDTTANVSIVGRHFVGGLVGEAIRGGVTRSRANSNVTGQRYVGGLIGGGQSYLVVEDSSATGNVSGTENVGGLAGKLDGRSFRCFATGQISGTIYVGGLTGNVTGVLDQVYATGKVLGTSYVGGLVGLGQSVRITNSYAEGKTEYALLSNANQIHGGLAGFLGGPGTTLTDSYATGAVLGEDYTGGLIGYLSNSDVSRSYATGAVSGTRSVGGLIGTSIGDVDINRVYATGSVRGYWGQVGGLIGYLGNQTSPGPESEPDGDLSYSYATGDVVVDSNIAQGIGGLVGETATPIRMTHSFARNDVRARRDTAAVGGFVGRVNSSSYSGRPTSSIEDCYSRSRVKGGSNVAGFVGEFYEQGNGTSFFIRNSYSSSVLIGKPNTNPFNPETSGFVNNSIGGIPIIVGSSYWDINNSGIVASEGGVGKSSVDMLKISTYVGWDFSQIWNFPSVDGVSYPILRNLTNSFYLPFQLGIYLEREISTHFANLLKRPAEPGAIQYYVSRYHQGSGICGVLRDILKETEYKNLIGILPTHSQSERAAIYVSNVFQSLLNRPIDTSLDFYKQLYLSDLSNGEELVIRHIISQVEFLDGPSWDYSCSGF